MQERDSQPLYGIKKISAMPKRGERTKLSFAIDSSRRFDYIVFSGWSAMCHSDRQFIATSTGGSHGP
jgi:hypothetical protein